MDTNKYSFKYVVDGEWKCDSNQVSEDDGYGNRNNIVIASMTNKKYQN